MQKYRFWGEVFMKYDFGRFWGAFREEL